MPKLTKLLKHLQLPSTPLELTQAQRLFHGRGHAFQGLHHITIDWLPPVILITLFAPESETDINKLSDKLLLLLPSCKSIQLQRRYELRGPIDVTWGQKITQLIIDEKGLKYHIQLGKSRNTGLFLDIKNGRSWAQSQAKNKRVLNLFAYTCGFSVAANAGGATSILNVDMSSPALNIGRENHRLNQQSLDHVKFEKLNIFKSFGRLKKRGPFDLLVCDPPTLQKGSVNIIKDYPKIMKRLHEFMAPRSTLLLCLNAPELNADFLLDNMSKFAPQYKYSESISTPDVFAEAEDKGLIVLVFKSQ